LKYLLPSKTRLYFPKPIRFCLAFSLLLFSSLVRGQSYNSLKPSSSQPQQFTSSEEAEIADAKFGAALDSLYILNSVAQRTSASASDMVLFNNYYSDKLLNDRNDFFNQTGQGINTQNDIEHYAAAKIEEYVTLYQNLQEIKKNFPNTVAEYTAPHPKITGGACQPSCSNIGFESGNLSGWNAYIATNNSSTTAMTYGPTTGGPCGAVTEAGWDNTIVKYKKDSDYQVKIMTGPGLDPIAGPLIPIVAPGGGNYSCRLGDTSVGGSRVAFINQTFQVTAGNTALNYMYAVLIDQAPHKFGQTPHFLVTITDQANGDTLQCGEYLVFSAPGQAGYTPIYYKIPSEPWSDTIYCKPWTSVFVSLQNYIGHCINIQALVSDCWPTAIGPHFCYVYFDATCGPFSIIASSPSVCGGNVNLTAPTGGTYVWAGAGIVGSNTGQTITANASGTYTVTITSADGCSDTLQKTVTITPTMSLTATSTNASCAVKGTATATVTGGTAPYTYNWSNGQTTSAISGLGPGTYTCTVSASGCKDSATTTVTGTNIVTANVTAVNELCSGNKNGTATVSGVGAGPFTYLWNNGTTNQKDTGLAVGTYTCVVSSTGGACPDSVTVTITQPLPLTIKATPFAATCWYLCNGQAIVVPNGGTNPYAYAWSNGGSGASVNNLCINSSYSIVVTDGHGCQHDTTVIVTNPPPIIFTTDSLPSLCGKANGSASLGSISGGTPGYTYTWSDGLTTSAINNVVAGTYSVVIKDANGCKDTAHVVVPNSSGDSVKIVSETNVSCNGGNNGSATAAASGGIAPYTYSWAATGGNTAIASNLTAGTYTVSATDKNGCTATAIATITQPPPIALTAPSDTTCIGQSATLTANATGGTAPYTYSWTPGGTGQSIIVTPGATSTYTVQATDANGCLSPQVIVVVTLRPPLTVVAGPPKSFCPGGTAVINATASGGDGVYSYSWSPGGATTSSITVAPTITTTYTVLLKDGCTTPSVKDSVIITVLPTPIVNLVADTFQGCYPLCVGFKNLATITGGATIASYNWNFGDGSTSDSANPHHCYTNPGVYSVSLSVTSSNGCSDSIMLTNYITVYSHPVADFSLSPQPTDIMNATIYFADHSTDAYGIANWLWQFGDGTDSTGIVKNPQHTYLDTGRYCVTLQVTNIHGCVATTVNCLYISPFFVIYVPNAFTPNSNGVNDLFTAKGVGILNYEMWIFDRWGQQLYYTTDIYGGWSGVVQHGSSGQQAQEDTYVWLIEVTDIFHKDHRYVGRVTLIR